MTLGRPGLILLAAVMVAAAAGVAACGTAVDERSASAGGAAAAPAPSAPHGDIVAGLRVVDDGGPGLPVTVFDATGTEVTVTSTERIIPANGDLAEVVFALGLGDQVVARDVSATFPPEVERLPSVGYQRTLPLEPIAAFEPTVVLANITAGPPETISGLRRLGYPVVVLDEVDDLDGPSAKLRAVGAVLGVPADGAALARTVADEISAATSLARATGEAPRVAALYLRGESVQLVFGPGSGISVLLEAAGALDIGAELGVNDTQPINLEALLAAQPDVLVVTDSGLASVGGVDGLLGLGGGALGRTPAGQARRVLAYDDQLLLGFGPRTGDALGQLVADLHPDLEEVP